MQMSVLWWQISYHEEKNSLNVVRGIYCISPFSCYFCLPEPGARGVKTSHIRSECDSNRPPVFTPVKNTLPEMRGSAKLWRAGNCGQRTKIQCRSKDSTLYIPASEKDYQQRTSAMDFLQPATPKIFLNLCSKFGKSQELFHGVEWCLAMHGKKQKDLDTLQGCRI
jgi:hypothetical protein